MFNSIKEEIRIMNNIIEEACIHGGDQGGCYLTNDKDLTNIVNIWLEKKCLKDKYKLVTEERLYKHCQDIFNTIPHIEPIDYDIEHKEWNIASEIKGWDFL